MIDYQYFELNNGLKVYVHQDTSSSAVAFNLCYNVGSRDENPEKTGFAHLFEHLMFGGSQHIPNYDEPLQRVGGENNAFTSPDITNYYITLPKNNLETAFWLESDRMFGLSFDPKVLEVQRSVVIEEFKQRYLNQPYGDLWLKLRPLAYTVHPYSWATIGKDISHIENATMDDVKDFFYTHYRPNNAVLVVAGDVQIGEIERLSRKYFGDIQVGKIPERKLPQEPIQTIERRLETEAKVPLDAIYKAFHVPGKHDSGFTSNDILADVLGRGKSSRLYQKLVKELKLFNNISAFVTGSLDPGLFIIGGNVNQGIDVKDAEENINAFITDTLNQGLPAEEIEKAKNQSFSSIAFGEVELLNRAMHLAFAANAGDPEYCNSEKQQIIDLTIDQVNEVAKNTLQKSNSNTLIYRTIN